MSYDDIEHRFNHHPPASIGRSENHADVRQIVRNAAHDLGGLLPDGREKSLAITKLEEAMFWANAAIARQVD